MSVEQNKATLRRIYAEIWNKGNWSVIPELIAPSYHYSNRKGHQGYKENVSSARSATRRPPVIAAKPAGTSSRTRDSA